jgi:hypothetical protein
MPAKAVPQQTKKSKRRAVKPFDTHPKNTLLLINKEQQYMLQSILKPLATLYIY